MHHEQYIPNPAKSPMVLSLKERVGLPEDYPAMNRAIRQGFEFGIIASIANETSLSEDEILNMLNLPRFTSIQRRKHRRFNRAESNRIYALIEVITTAEVLFERNLSDAIHWLKKPCKALGKRSPIENLNSFFEFQQVVSVIHRLENGVFN